MSEYTYRPLTPGGRQFRLLHVASIKNNFSGKTGSDDSGGVNASDGLVSCSITHDCLDHSPEYNALSYTWGDASLRSPILIDGAIFSATQNLEAALRHLAKHHDGPLILWVDALCINQDDNEEKNEQLAQMRQIYVQAQSVIAWLGPTYNNSDIAMKWIREYGGQSFELGIGSTTGPRLISLLDALDTPEEINLEERSRTFAHSLRGQLSGENKSYNDLITALIDLFRRAYWSRIWIVQELASASHSVFVCGSEIVPDHSLYDALRLLRNFAQYEKLKRIRDATYPPPQDVSLMAIKTDGPINILKFRRSTHPASLTHIIRSFRRFDATDPRDKIFALLGMSKDAESLGLRADYNKSCEEVYTDVARRLIQAGYMDLLGLIEQPKLIPGLQSWVPDWSLKTHRSPLQVRSHDRKGVPGTTLLEPKFSASGIKEPVNLEKGRVVGPKHLPLMLSGTCLGEVEHLGFDWKHNAVGRWLHDLQKLSHLISDAHELAKGREHAVWRVAVGDQEIRQGVRKPRLAEEKIHIAHNAFKDTDLTSIDEQAMIKEGLNYYCEQIQLIAKGRRPLLTSAGHLGIGPSETEPGDLVFILIRSDTPYILRRDVDEKDKFRLVGEAYFHGVMDGEAMEKNPAIETIAIC